MQYSTLGRSALFAWLAAFGAMAAFATIAPSRLAQPEPAQPVSEPLAVPVTPAAPATSPFVREERFQRGDTLGALLERLGVVDDEAQRLVRLRSLRELRPGTYVSAEIGGDGGLVALSWLSGKEALVRIAPEGSGYARSESAAPLDTRVGIKAGVVRSSLFGATDAAGIPDSVAIQLADIFGGDVDFLRDLRKGDRFTVVYETQYFSGRAVRAGRVLAAEFVNQGKTFRAVRYGSGYYTPDVHNMRKTFLRAPLEFSRISSGFGMRVHPIARTWKKHEGIDYAAATGARVRATGDGVVEFAGVKGGYGNVVVLRHYGQYKTVYAHLSRFASGLHRGERVAQGELIGYVGQTGWATGPHLHYEFQVGGHARNPRTLALPSAQPVPQAQMAEFLSQSTRLTARLDLADTANLASVE
jgi:murein DD-endopeptidase MepM/ murein hydrolase activator NlpD